MRSPIAESFRELLENETPPCISIYLPVRRGKPQAAENARRLKNLIRDAQDQLEKRYPKREYEPLIGKLRGLEGDPIMWEQPADGLAIFSSPKLFRVIPLARSVDEMSEVANSFHLKPLIRAHQFTGRFQILCLTQGNVTLYEGNHDRLDDVPLRHVPHTLVEALGDQITEPERTHSWHAGRGLSAPASHGHHSKKDEDENDIERFFRVIDRAILENHSKPSGLPLILCGISKYHDRFRKVSHNAYLVPRGIKLNPESMSIDRLHEEAWKIIAPYYRQQIERIIEEYGLARAHQQGSEDPVQVAEAATQSRVGTLLVDADRKIGGKIDPASGRVEFGELDDPQFDDLLDEIAEQVIKTGGEVLIMPHNEMPTDTGVAAIYRF